MGEEPRRRQRRQRYTDALYRKTTYYTDVATGERRPYTYWQAAREVAPEDLEPGHTRQRVTGNGSSEREARSRLEVNWKIFHSRLSPDAQEPPPRRGRPRVPVSVPPPPPDPSEGRTVKDVYEAWQEGNERGAVSDQMAYKYKGYFTNHVLPHIGDILIADLDDDVLRMLFYDTLARKTRGDGMTPLLSTAALRNIYMAVSGCLKYAVVKRWIPTSPLKSVKAPSPQPPVVDIESVSVYARDLLAALAERDDACRWLLQFLGLRRAERLGLTWKNVTGLDTGTPTLIIQQQLARYADGSGWYIKEFTKTRTIRRVVVPEPFLSSLRAHKTRQDQMRTTDEFRPAPQFADLVFLRPNGGIYTLNRDNSDWRALLKELGLPYWRAHLNRHITATWLAEADPPIPIGTVRQILGHASDAMTHYYSHSTRLQQEAPMRRYGQKIRGAMADGPAESTRTQWVTD